MICGHCKNSHSTVAEVRACAGLPSARNPEKPCVTPTEGMWVINSQMVNINGKEFPAVYKIQKAHHGSGTLYAKRLADVDCDGRLIWEYCGRQIFPVISERGTKMTIEQAAEFGQLYGRCARCGRILTNELSIERAIGPVCYAKLMEGR